MKRGLILPLTFVLASTSILCAQEAGTNAARKITAAEAKANVGKEVTVTGTVADVNKAERLVRLNLDKPYPNQTLTAVIWADKTNLFPEIEKLKGKSVGITGKITEYRSRPEIVISRTNQVTVLQTATDKQSEERK
jgi:DNA/RNA endonuclease YhcR with UshA esterase domain